MKYLLFVLSALFFFFATLQFNDPDPVAWIIIYGGLGVFSALTALEETRTYFRYAMLATILVSGIWMFSLLPDFLFWLDMGAPNLLSSWEENLPMIELAREFVGLGICAVVCGYYLHVYASRAEMGETTRSAISRKAATA